jgi:hypothetical protein
MARVYFNRTWFTSIRSDSWNESDYESVVLSNANVLFPQWVVVPFKTNVVGEDGTVKQPDIALIDHKYRRWCVVEVELANHHFANHVAPQVEAFRTARYGDEHALYLSGQNSALDLSRLRSMIRGEPPQVLVVVDRPDTDWKKRLKAIDVALSIVEPFREENGTQMLLRVNGEAPDLPGNLVTRISRMNVRRLWKVHSPATLPVGDEDDVLTVQVKSLPTRWKRTPLGGGVMLAPLDTGDVLRGWKAVDILQHEDGSLSVQPVVPE